MTISTSAAAGRPDAGALPAVAALIVAGGRGRRAGGGEAIPKQYRMIGGRTVLARTLEVFLRHPRVARIAVVIHPDDHALYAAAVADLAVNTDRLLPPVTGGAERQASVRAGLDALAAEAPGAVLIHDAVRPFVDAATVSAVADALADHEAACAGVPVVDTLKRCRDGSVEATVPREGLWRAATPQGFRFPAILAAHRAAAAAGREDFTDDTAVAEWHGARTVMVACGEDNMKLTHPEDFARAERRLLADALLANPLLATGDVRVGNGYDVHVLEPGDGVTLGGVFIPHDRRLRGHSDADVVLHALTDAILGALGDGDIGRHFPPSEEKWRGAPSSIFLADAVRRVGERGGVVAHLDASIVAEEPKVGPHREAMRARIAEIAGIDLDRVGIKATTSEGLGFAGRREGIAAFATATIRLPFSVR